MCPEFEREQKRISILPACYIPKFRNFRAMEKIRSKRAYSLQTGDFRKDMLVVCPKCEKQALANVVPDPDFSYSSAIRVTCTHCGFNTIYQTNRLLLPLWLATPFEDNWIAVYNYEHLAFLKNHIEAYLRERNGQPKSNTSIGSRLPRWMTSKKNRRRVLKCLEKLEEMKP